MTSLPASVRGFELGDRHATPLLPDRIECSIQACELVVDVAIEYDVEDRVASWQGLSPKLKSHSLRFHVKVNASRRNTCVQDERMHDSVPWMFGF
jgi:hypothetical protein